MKFTYLMVLLNILNTTTKEIYDDDDDMNSKSAAIADFEFEPIVPQTKESEKITLTKNLNCYDFQSYAFNCTINAAMIYNSSRKSPPMPAKINDWCRAIRHLTMCAIDWNSECQHVTDIHFHEESIKGHMHVVSNVCDDEWFLRRYDELPLCIDRTAEAWETCYIDFKSIVDYEKNLTREWTHYETHFQLCCARSLFRRCTLQVVFELPSTKCSRSDAAVLQKFSVIVSEGDVYQECYRNMMYENCPGGDPRPQKETLLQLMSTNTQAKSAASIRVNKKIWIFYIIIYVLIILVVFKYK